MALGTLKIKADSSQAVKEIDRISNAWKQSAMALAGAGGFLYALDATMGKIGEIAQAQGTFSSLVGAGGKNALDSYKALAGVTDHLIKSFDLFRARNILMNSDLKVSQEQMEAVAKASVELSRKTGDSAEQVLRTLSRAIVTGSADAIRRYGVIVDTTGGKAQVTQRLLHKLSKEFGNIEIKAGDAGEKTAQFNNRLQESLVDSEGLATKLHKKYLQIKDDNIQFASYMYDVLTNSNTSRKKQADLLTAMIAKTGQQVQLERTQLKLAREVYLTRLKASIEVYKYDITNEKAIKDIYKTNTAINRTLQLRREELNKQILIAKQILHNDYASGAQRWEATRALGRARAELKAIEAYEKRVNASMSEINVKYENFNKLINKAFEGLKFVLGITKSTIGALSGDTGETKKETKVITHLNTKLDLRKENIKALTKEVQLLELANSIGKLDASKYQELQYKRELLNLMKQGNWELVKQLQLRAEAEKLLPADTIVKEDKNSKVKQQNDALAKEEANFLKAQLEKQKQINKLKEAEAKRHAEEIKKIYDNMQSTAKSSFHDLTAIAVKSMMIENSKLKELGKTRSQYYQEQLKAWLDAKAVEYGVKAVEYGAMALVDMWLNPAKASADATASATFASLAVLAKGTAMGINTKSASGGSGGSGNTSTNQTNPAVSGVSEGSKGSTINIIINDSVVGNDPDEVARAINKMINSAQDRGVIE